MAAHLGDAPLPDNALSSLVAAAFVQTQTHTHTHTQDEEEEEEGGVYKTAGEIVPVLVKEGENLLSSAVAPSYVQ
jgi:hypothetical protein